MADRRDTGATWGRLAHATYELRLYANVLEGYRARVAQVGRKLEEDAITKVDWGVRGGIFHPIEAGDAMEYQPADTPVELLRFKNAYERAHQAMITRLGKLGKAFVDDAAIYRTIAKNYEQDDEIRITEDGDLRGS